MLKIEFLYYNKKDCKRCASTEKSVKMTLKEIKKATKDYKEKIILKERILPESEISMSPTLLINGKDMEEIINKRKNPISNECKDCCKLSGKKVNCRTFFYKGKEYEYIPKEMIIEAIKLSMK